MFDTTAQMYEELWRIFAGKYSRTHAQRQRVYRSVSVFMRRHSDHRQISCAHSLGDC